jgi:DNA segregation ATPase FtsK/SpoIIIE, S-DNA-T family
MTVTGNGHVTNKDTAVTDAEPFVVEGEVVPAVDVERGVDTSTPPVKPARKGGELKPIVADWLKDRTEFVATVKDVGHRAGHTTVWHVVHSPFHAGRILKYAPRGVFRTAKTVSRWVLHAEVRPMQRELVAKNEAKDWTTLEKERKERVALRWRLGAIGTVLLSICVALWWWLMPRWALFPGWWFIPTWVLTPWWTTILITAISTVTFGYIGRPLDKDKPLIRPASSPYTDTPLTNDVVLEALCSLGIAKMNTADDIELLYGVKPTRAGYNIDLTLPRGVTATSVMAKREQLSSGLQRSIDTVWPSVGPRHSGHLVLFISHEGMSAATQKVWPLLKAGTVDLFDSIPMFTDQRGDWVSISIATKSGVVGAIPRMGKTYFLRELGLVAGLDVRAEVYTFELKGTGDMSSHKLFAHYYSDSDEEEDIADHLKVMRTLKAERRRRAKVIKSLPDERCPRSEVTSELASDRSLGLHPIVVIIDECQTWTEYKIKAVQEEFNSIIEELVRKGPAVGIQVFLATQKVDAKSIPTHISNMATVRLCFKVEDWQSNNQILGPGSFVNGNQATMFDFEKDKGVAYLKDGGPAQIVRTVGALDKIESEKVALRARAARDVAGRLTGYAAGADMDQEETEVVLLDDCRRVMGNAKTMHLIDMALGLGGLRPTLYGNLDATSLGSQLRTAGVQTGSVYVAGKARDKRSATGVKREWLDVASTELVGNSDPGEQESLRDHADDQ